MLHAICLSVGGASVVGHTHPVPVNIVLCSPHAERMSSDVLFPEQVVILGRKPVFVPYMDPGLTLARAVQQEMLRQMISDKVVVTADEKPQPVSTAADASQRAGFSAQALGARTDTPKFVVGGQHAFHMTIDRTRLQDIFDQAGRADLLLPATLDGANVSVNVPRSIMVEYGDCPEAHPAGSTQSTPTQPHSTAWANCLALQEVPSPLVNMPSDLNLQQLAEIGFQLAGMSATQARSLGQTIDWKSTLVLPIPRFASSYRQVTVNGVQGTLIEGSGRRGPDYVLVWVKNGMIYGLVGHGDSSNAVALANSLK